MSSTIIYHMLAVTIPKDYTGLEQDLFAVLAQCGCSRTYESSSGNARRVRAWQAWAFGTHEQVIDQTITEAGTCEGGGMSVGHHNSGTTPEQYITKVRNLLKKAESLDITRGPIPFKEGQVNMHFYRTVPATEPAGEPQTEKVYLGDQADLQKLLHDPEFMQMTQRTYAYNFLKTTGPEIRR